MDTNQPLTKGEFEEWANGTKETLNSIEENMATKSDLVDLATKSKLTAMKSEILTSVDTLTKRITDLLDKDYPSQKVRISRVEFRTEKLLGKKLDATDAAFDEKYAGERQ